MSAEVARRSGIASNPGGHVHYPNRCKNGMQLSNPLGNVGRPPANSEATAGPDVVVYHPCEEDTPQNTFVEGRLV